MNKYELFPGIYANKGQTEALDLLYEFLRSDEKVFMLCGKGGTGKTTIIKKMIEHYPGKLGGIAISHKAKKVLGLSIGHDKVMTVASALCIKLNEETGEFTIDEYERNKDEIPLSKWDLTLVDEASMISDEIIKEIKKVKKKNGKIIFLGDDAQLPPVGSNSISSVFKIKNQYILTEKMRQAATSPIINIGEIININQGSKNPLLRALKPEDRVNRYDELSDSSVLFESDEKKVLNMYVEDFKLSKGNTDFCKMVTFNNENHNHPQSVKNLNIKIRELLWGKEPKDYNIGEMLTAYDSYYQRKLIGYRGSTPMYSSACLFYNSEDFVVVDVGDIFNKEVELTYYSRFTHEHYDYEGQFEVIELTLQNNDTHEIINVEILTSNGKQKLIEECKYLWNYSKKLFYDLKNLFPNLQYGYAITSHKAQGSSYINTYVFEDNILGNSNGSSIQAKNQSLYVAVSRPRKKLVMLSKYNNPIITDDNKEVTKIINFRNICKKELHAELYNNNDELLITSDFDAGLKTKIYVTDMLFYKINAVAGKYKIIITTSDNEIFEFKHIKK